MVAPNVSARGADDVDKETKWLREASAMLNLSGMTSFVNLDVGTARQIQRPGKLRTMS